MSRNASISLVLLTFSAAGIADIKMQIGDGLIDGARLDPYHLTWQQCSFQDGQWLNQGLLIEELAVIDDLVLRHRQTASQPGGAKTQLDTFFDRSSFAPLRIEMEAIKDGNRLAYSERKLNPQGYSGFSVQGETTNQVEGKITSQMLNGRAMGLPLATMQYQDEPVEFVASMISFDGTYDVIAEWAGRETLQFAGEEVELWLIDVEWHHRESGDVYPAGPDASGGRYWVAHNPPDGFPYVPRYKTDTYAIEFVQSTCPAAMQ